MSAEEVAREISKMLVPNKDETPLRLRYAIVAAVTAPTVTITLAGTDVTTVRRLTDYTPAVSDLVAVLQNGPDLLVIGKVA